jgi:hypothetical protein
MYTQEQLDAAVKAAVNAKEAEFAKVLQLAEQTVLNAIKILRLVEQTGGGQKARTFLFELQDIQASLVPVMQGYCRHDGQDSHQTRTAAAALGECDYMVSSAGPFVTASTASRSTDLDRLGGLSMVQSHSSQWLKFRGVLIEFYFVLGCLHSVKATDSQCPLAEQ